MAEKLTPQQHQAVQPMGLGDDLDAVGDVVTGGKDEVVAVVAAGQTVAAGDGAELGGHTAGTVDTELHLLGDLLEILMSRNDIRE